MWVKYGLFSQRKKSWWWLLLITFLLIHITLYMICFLFHYTPKNTWWINEILFQHGGVQIICRFELHFYNFFLFSLSKKTSCFFCVCFRWCADVVCVIQSYEKEKWKKFFFLLFLVKINTQAASLYY